jgi:hypothetical protein
MQATALDRIDGGLTLCVRVSGTWPIERTGGSVVLEDIALDVYLPPRKIEEHCQILEIPIAQIVQIFGEHIAPHHLHQLRTRCRASAVELLPTQYAQTRLANPGNALLIPLPIQRGSSHYRFPVCQVGMLSPDFQDFLGMKITMQPPLRIIPSLAICLISAPKLA